MAKSVRAELSEKVKKSSLIKIAVVGTISLAGLILSIFSIFGRKYISSPLYLIAGIMGALYAIIEINYTRTPSVECDGETLCLNTWDNCVFPYRVDFKPRFFADFLPAKNISYTLPCDEISNITIGTEGFLKKSLNSRELDERFKKFSHISKRVALYVKRSEILCVQLKDGQVFIMSVRDFDMDKLYKVIDMIEHSVSGVEINTNIRKLRKKRETI